MNTHKTIDREYKVVYADGSNPTRCDEPLQEGYHFATKPIGVGGPWDTDSRTFETLEEAAKEAEECGYTAAE